MEVVILPEFIEEKLTRKEREDIIGFINEHDKGLLEEIEKHVEDRFESKVKVTVVESEGRLRKEIMNVRQEIADAKAELRKEITQSQASLLRWLVGLMIAQTGVLVGLLLLILKFAGGIK